MRVIAGSRRSMPLKTPDGDGTRPTTDRTKETLFNVLQMDIPGRRFLDLFSGSGGIGIEALSRGASEAVFVENGKQPISCIKENLKFTNLSEQAVLMETDAMTALERLKGKGEFDVIFMDPPYHAGYENDVFRTLSRADYVTPYTIIVVEALLETDFSFLQNYNFEIYKVKKYKTNQHVFIRKIALS